jgi:putative oxidoreductase
MGPQSTVPDFLQALAAVAEFGGGIALIFGFLTTIAAFGILCNMIGALWLVHIPQGHAFVNPGGASMELPALFLAIAFCLMLTGPGTWSLDAMMFGRGRVAVDERTPTELRIDRAA